MDCPFLRGKRPDWGHFSLPPSLYCPEPGVSVPIRDEGPEFRQHYLGQKCPADRTGPGSFVSSSRSSVAGTVSAHPRPDRPIRTTLQKPDCSVGRIGPSPAPIVRYGRHYRSRTVACAVSAHPRPIPILYIRKRRRAGRADLRPVGLQRQRRAPSQPGPSAQVSRQKHLKG